MKKIFLFMFVLMLLFSSACAAAPAQATVPTLDVGAIHTAAVKTMLAGAAAAAHTPSPSPSAALTEAAPSPTQTPTPTAEPAVISVPTMADVPSLGAVRGPGVRVLEQPAAVVRDGITVAVEQVAVYPERVELVYTVRNIPRSVLFDPFADDESVVCGGPDSYANLLLPDGRLVYSEPYLLDGKAFGVANESFARSYIIHLFKADVPADVHEMKMVLACLELARLDRAPRDWVISFRVQ
jgi:hypothetical protein